MLFAAFTLLFSILARGALIPFPYGLTLGPTSITASRYVTADDIEVLQFPAGPEYIAHCQQSLRHYRNSSRPGENSTEIESMLRKEVQMVSDRLNATLGTYASLAIPRTFTSISQGAAYYSLFPKGVTDRGKKHTQWAGVTQFACQAYDINTWKKVGRTAANEDLVLVLEYEEQFLYSSIAVLDLDYHVFPIDSANLSLDLGESSKIRLREKSDNDAYTHALREHLETFINSSVPEHERNDIRAIVVHESASTDAIAELQTIAYDAVANDVVEVLDSIDPMLLAAYGVARLARLTEEDPQRWTLDDVIHDEL
ncbi:hypothetical protein BDV95DRAFT_613124 [Massariosphaeria phaeospora]|uniref:Uncharacterized protein n=1 Tax=Massariosphaeria phaeospora TaxID=100035 RepID=A0A7C8I2B6_9PLEO|nr:hypothetical protein BDV95DRAFT_613124 [Massariosphaeria phaeospora]